MKALFLLPLALAVLAGFAMAEESATCSNAKFKVAPFMNKPVTEADLDQLLAPVWNMMGGGAMGQFDLATMQPKLMGYLKTYAIQPIAGVGALFVLVLLLLALLLFWRCFRCLCVVCCQQEAYADPSKVLFSRRLRIYKCVMLLLGLVGCAMAAWGMASLNQQFPAAVSKEVDIIQQFPEKLLLEVDGLANQTANISAPLDAFENILNQINITGMQQDIAHISDFLTNAPTPSELKQIIEALDDALKVALSGTLGALKSEIDSTNSTSALNVLLGHLNTISAFSTNDTRDGLNAYNDAILAVAAGSDPSTKISLGAVFTNLQATHNTVAGTSGIAAWLSNIANAKAAAQAIDAARSSSSANPFKVIQKHLTDVASATTDIKTNKLTNLSSTIGRFNGMWNQNASAAFDRLLDRALFVNSSIMVLSDDIGSKITMMNDSLVQINDLYTGDSNLNEMPATIDSLANNLTLSDTSALTTKLQGADQQLDSSAADLAYLIASLDNLTSALQSLQPAVASIGSSISDFDANDDATNWSALKADLQGPNGVQVAVAAGIFSAADLGPFATSTASSIKGTMSSASGDMSSQVSAIGAVQQSIADFSLQDFQTALDGADSAYSSFGGNPSSLLQPVSELLTTISDLTQNTFGEARGKIDEVSNAMREASETLRNATISNLDRLQAKYLVSTTEGAPATAQKFMNYAYYGLMGAYAVVLVLILFIFLFTWKNCPSGLCMTGFVLNILLVFFALLPIFYTIFMLLMRDTCANVEYVALKAVSMKMGNDSMAFTVANYYLGGGKAPDGTDMSVSQLVTSIKPDLDIDAMKAQVNNMINSTLADVETKFTFKELVTEILDDVKNKVRDMIGTDGSIDRLIALLDYPSISGVWLQFKGWLCCDLGDQLFVQWAACVILLGMAWVVLACGYLVLKNLDGLSDSCCACACYNPKDYQAGAPDSDAGGRLDSKMGKRLSSIEGGDETVAVININATAGGEKGAKTYEMIDSTPLPPPLAVATSSPSAPVLASPRMYPSISSPPVQSGAYLPHPATGELQQQRASLMGPAMYANPNQLVSGSYGYVGQQAGAYMQQQPAPQQQGWGRTSPAPHGGSYPRI